MFAFIHLSYNVLQEKSGSSKNKCTFPWNCTSWTLDLEKFRYGKSIVRIVNKTRRQSSLFTTRTTVAAPWLNDRRCTLTAHIVYYTTVDRNTLTPLLLYVVDLLYNLTQSNCAAIDKISTDSASRRLSAVAQLLVFIERAHSI